VTEEFGRAVINMANFGAHEETREWKFTVYEDLFGEYRWSLQTGNGDSMADSAKGYGTQAECLAAIAEMKWQTPQAQLINLAVEQ
jgi:uncharacterized protein YegP (UPF0339 family)